MKLEKMENLEWGEVDNFVRLNEQKIIRNYFRLFSGIETEENRIC